MCSVMLDAVSNATKEQSMVQAGGIAGRQRHRQRHRQRQHAGAPAYSSAKQLVVGVAQWGSLEAEVALGFPLGQPNAACRLVCVHGYHMHAIVIDTF